MSEVTVPREELLRVKHRAAFRIGLVMAGIVIFYGFLLQAANPAQRSDVGMTRVMLYFMAIAELPVALFLRQILLKKAAQEDFDRLVNKLFVSNVIVLAVCGAPAVYGLILGFMGAPRADYYILATYSLVLLICFFPKFDQWQTYIAGAR